MNLIATLRDSDTIEGGVDLDPTNFRLRTAARAVVLDDQHKVALLYVGIHDYYKLPGGGIEDGEDIMTALDRELLEEIGCKADVIGEVGQTIQLLSQSQLKQISYCYLAKQVGEKSEPNYTDEERQNGFQIYWAKDIDEAIACMEKSNVDDYRSKSIVKRDLALLRAAKPLIV